MSDSFDPYHSWLGISPKDLSANYYRLLGIDLFESDANVIESAADRQMSHIRTFQTGKHSRLSQQVLSEIAAARITLLNAQKKAQYDKDLKAKLEQPKPPGDGPIPKCVWYLRANGSKPSGPVRAEEIIQSWKTGKLRDDTLCWREGMPDWLPLTLVEPFASTMRPARSKPAKRGRLRRVLGVVLLVACLAAVGVVGYFYWTSWSTIHRAKGLIAAGQCDKAQRLLRPLMESRFFAQQAKYLVSLAEVREYASEKDEQGSRANPLRRPKERLQRVFAVNDRWRQQAKSDFPGKLADVPLDAPDVLTRSLTIACFLQELELADAKLLAKALLDRAKHRAVIEIPIPFIREVLDWDPSLAGEVVALVLPKKGTDPGMAFAGLRMIDEWVRQQPSLAEPLSTGLFQCADHCSQTGEYQLAEELATRAARIIPGVNGGAFTKQLQYVKKRLDDRDYAGAVHTLNRIISESPRLLDDLAKLCRDHLEGLRTSGQLTRLDRAIKERAEVLKNKDLYEAHMRAGNDALKTKQFDDAIKHFNDALILFPDNEHATNGRDTAECSKHVEKSRELLKQGDLERAEAELESALSLPVVDPDAAKLQREIAEKYKIIGQQWQDKKNFENAIKAFEKALAQRPLDDELRKLLKIAIDSRDDKAVKDLRASAKNSMASGKYTEAKTKVQEALTIRPDDATASALLAEINDKIIEGLLEEAKKLMDRLEYEQAKQKVSEALTIGTHHPTAKARLDEIHAAEVDPATANLSGDWHTPLGVTWTLTGQGKTGVTVQIVRPPKGMQQGAGSFERKGKSLDGKFQVLLVGNPNPWTVSVMATVQEANKILVRWDDYDITDRVNRKAKGRGHLDFTKQ